MNRCDSPEFIDHLAGLYRDCTRLAESAARIQNGANQRIEAIRRNGFLRLAEIGDGLIEAHVTHPDEFEAWFSAHQKQLGFCLRTARRCKEAARQVASLGLEEAIVRALEKPDRDRPEPFFRLSLSLPVAPDQVPVADIAAWLERIRPAVEVYHQLEVRAAEA